MGTCPRGRKEGGETSGDECMDVLQGIMCTLLQMLSLIINVEKFTVKKFLNGNTAYIT